MAVSGCEFGEFVGVQEIAQAKAAEGRAPRLSAIQPVALGSNFFHDSSNWLMWASVIGRPAALLRSSKEPMTTLTNISRVVNMMTRLNARKNT